MGSIDELRAKEAEREALEAQSRRRWESMDLRRLNEDMKFKEFGEDLLEEAKRRAAEKGV